MNNRDCTNCVEYKRCKDSHISWLFFIIGLVSTIAIRLVTVLVHLNPAYSKMAWYIGVMGFFLFFIYKFNINQSRARIIKQKGLLEKVKKRQSLTEEDSNHIAAILCALSLRKERINYVFIFGLSVIALLAAIYMDFFR